MPKTRVQKEEIVKKLTDKLKRSKSLVFTDYQGLTMQNLSQIRDKLFDLNSEFSITKNNLLKIALKDADIKIDEKLLEGPVATLFSFDDEIAPIKVLVGGLKEVKIGKVRAGLLGREFLETSKVQELADLPSKDELKGKVVAGLGAPIYGVINVLQANLRGLVLALEQIKNMKGGEA